MKKLLACFLVLVLLVPMAAFAEDTGLKDGEYVTTGRGHENYLHVCTTIQDGKIADVEVLTHDETIGIGTFAVERMPGMIVETQNTAVDTISGCTITSFAIRSAVEQAVEMAGGTKDMFRKEVEQAPVDETVVEENVDVVIMGAGTSGLVAAARLLEQGLDVLLFEKMDIPGGSMPTTYGGVMSYGSELEANWGLGREGSLEAALESSKKRPNPEFNRFDGETPYNNKMLTYSGPFVDWMHSIGVGFFQMGLHYGNTPFLAPGAYQGGPGYAMESLVDRIGALGGRIIYATPVVDLIQSEDGRITGLVAKGKDGKTWNVTADAVMLASGGFAANPEMVAQYYPYTNGSRFNCTPGSTGDGILLGQKYGAGIECMGRAVTTFLSTYASKYELAFLHYTTPGLIVNINGDSIGNICRDNHGMLAANKRDPKNGDTFYYIFDEASRWRTKRCYTDGLPYRVSYEPIFETGECVHYDSLEQAAEELKLPNLVQTIETNNAHALAGEADEFGRDNLPYIDTSTGVYMMRVDPTYYLTTGGLCADTDCHILTENGEIIEGLYGAGDVIGSIEEKDGMGYGMGFDAAMIYGYIAAETIAEEVLQ